MEKSKIELLAKHIADEIKDQKFTAQDWVDLKDKVVSRLGSRVRLVSDYTDTKGQECKLDVVYVFNSPAYHNAVRVLVENGNKFTIEPFAYGW